MVIQHNISAINSYRNYTMNSSSLSKNLEKLSSGYRINRAADDAAGLAISEQMRQKINGLDQATSNAKDAIGLIQTEEGALTEVHSMLQRMTTLATQAANGTYNSVAKDSIQKEVSELSDEIDRIATATDYNGIKPLTVDGSKPKLKSMTMQVGPTAGETLTVNKFDVHMSNIFKDADPDLKISGDKNHLSIWKGKESEETVANVSVANKAITAITNAINKVSGYRADLGAKQNRIEHTINNLQTTSENITAAESRIRDTDMAKEIAAYTKNNVLSQAAQSMLAQANQQPQQVLQLLG